MKRMYALPLLGSMVWTITGCVGPQSRSSARSDEFAAWTPEVQQVVLAGQIAPGFTREQVQAALGLPHYKSVVDDEQVGEIWGYRESRPRPQYAFRARSTFADPPRSADEPRFLVFFDRDFHVLAVKNAWW